MLSNFRCLSYNKLYIIRIKISFKSIIQNNFTDISLLLLVLLMQKCWRIWKLDKSILSKEKRYESQCSSSWINYLPTNAICRISEIN